MLKNSVPIRWRKFLGRFNKRERGIEELDSKDSDVRDIPDYYLVIIRKDNLLSESVYISEFVSKVIVIFNIIFKILITIF